LESGTTSQVKALQKAFCLASTSNSWRHGNPHSCKIILAWFTQSDERSMLTAKVAHIVFKTFVARRLFQGAEHTKAVYTAQMSRVSKFDVKSLGRPVARLSAIAELRILGESSEIEVRKVMGRRARSDRARSEYSFASIRSCVRALFTSTKSSCDLAWSIRKSGNDAWITLIYWSDSRLSMIEWIS